MKILQANNTFILVNFNDEEIHLVDSTTLVSGGSKISSGSLQYGTGVAAYSIGSRVHFYDFFYKRVIEVVQTYKTILKICVRKNLLLVVSEQRILIYNLQKKQNECYIETLNGKLVFLDDNYFRLAIFYPQDHQILVNKCIWKNLVHKVSTGLKYQLGTYMGKESQYVVLALQNTLSFYEQTEMVKVKGYQHKITQIHSITLPTPMIIIMLQNNEIIAQDLNHQWKFNFQQLPINPLSQIQSKFTVKPPIIKPQSFFWTAKGKIYHWIRTSGEQVPKLYRGDLQERIETQIQADQLICRKSYVKRNSVENINEKNEEQSTKSTTQ